MEKTLEGLFSADIGELVNESVINSMTKFINDFGDRAFTVAVYEGAFSEYAYAYIHPCDEMRSTKNFDIIQKAYFNAYT